MNERRPCTDCGEVRLILTAVGWCTPCAYKNQDARFYTSVDRAVEHYYSDEYKDEHKEIIDLGGEA